MTMTSKLIERAEFYEQKAQALRLAAAELNGDLTEKATKDLPTRLAKAIQLRGVQQPPRPDAKERQQLLRDWAAQDTPTNGFRMSELVGRFREIGVTATVYTTRRDLTALGWLCHGKTNLTRWFPPAPKGTSTTKPAKKSRSYRKTSEKASARGLTTAILHVIEEKGEPVSKDTIMDALHLEPNIVAPVIGSLKRYGYVKEKNELFSRTKKVFTPKGSAAQQEAQA
jgi:hypothetical protein